MSTSLSGHYLRHSQVLGDNGKGIYRLNVFLLKPWRFLVQAVGLQGLLFVASNADPEWVTYGPRLADPVLMFLPTILARWIVDNLFRELNLPNPVPPSANDGSAWPDSRGRVWSTKALNWVLQKVLVPAGDGTQLAVFGGIEHESELCEGTPRIRCRTQCRGKARKVSHLTVVQAYVHLYNSVS